MYYLSIDSWYSTTEYTLYKEKENTDYCDRSYPRRSIEEVCNLDDSGIFITASVPFPSPDFVVLPFKSKPTYGMIQEQYPELLL